MSELNELADKLKSEGEKIYAFFADLTDERWRAKVYTEGETWSTRDVLSHLISSERGLINLFERIRAGGEGVSEDFSINRYNAAQQERMKDLPPHELLEQYKEVRSNSVAWVAGLKEEELEIQGRHPFLGMTKIRDMIKLLYVHNQNHYRDIKKVLKP
ncbi:MAG: maleylpyruvate isomerase N-terminal domain-containing protein [Anaerolineaceae bacterium]|nr:maleylpyruvate isomerase N-terminal domain-containing protein [Anaerolineaceae bacterium]